MNQRGQALIESMVLLIFIFPATFYLIKIGLHLQQEILVDEVMEQTLLCHFKGKKNCTAELHRQLDPFSKSPVYIRLSPLQKKVILQVIMETRYGTTLNVESEMSLDLSVP